MEGRQGAPVFAHGGVKGGVGAQRSIGTDAIDVAALDSRRCVWHECCVPPVHIRVLYSTFPVVRWIGVTFVRMRQMRLGFMCEVA